MTTEDDSRRHGGVAARSSARFTLVLEAERPAEGSLQVDLADAPELVIGRGSERRFVRDGAVGGLLTVPDRWMSTEHARVRMRGETAQLVDSGSHNGTFVRGHRVEQTVLSDGDVVELGHTCFLFRAPVRLERDAAALLPPTTLLETFNPALDCEYRRLSRIAASEVPVLLLGETGTGKELVAAEVHRISARNGPLIPVNCPAIPETLLESELFGCRKGAYSGAVNDRDGLIRAADGGTLFLDEVGDLPLPAQAALLRVLETSDVVPLGDTRPAHVDVRVVAATHRDLDRMVRAGTFREDLLARLSGFRLRLPALRHRREDLGLLIAFLLRRRAGASAAQVRLEPDAACALMFYDWPLNVRELDKCLSSALVLSAGERISLSHLPDPVRAALEQDDPLEIAELEAADEQLRDELLRLLREHHGNVTAVARAQGKARMQVQRWLKRYHLDPEGFRH